MGLKENAIKFAKKKEGDDFELSSFQRSKLSSLEFKYGKGGDDETKLAAAQEIAGLLGLHLESYEIKQLGDDLYR